MAFQNVVRFEQGTGIAGEIAREGPQRAAPWNLLSASLPNVIGYVYTINTSAPNTAQVGESDPFVGILGFPKEQSLIGDGIKALAPFYELPNNSVGQLITMGILYVNLTLGGVVGDPVFYDADTGEILGITGGGTPVAISNAKIILADVGAGELGIIELTS